MIRNVIGYGARVKLHVSATENVVNERGEVSICIQSCWSVNALSTAKRGHDVGTTSRRVFSVMSSLEE